MQDGGANKTYKGAVSKRPRVGNEGSYVRTVYCVLQQSAGFSSHSHLFTPHIQAHEVGDTTPIS